MVEQIARAIAKADDARFDDDRARFRGLALAALRPLARPTESMIDPAYEAVRFDEHWAVNSRRDFRKGVRAMILAAMEE
jgi:hypothetical protein